MFITKDLKTNIYVLSCIFGFISISLLLGAWFFQYVLGYAPCTMCYWQRDAHKFVLLIALIGAAAYTYRLINPRWIACVLGFACLVSFSIAFWHVGVEYKWWDGPKTCQSLTGPSNIDPANLLDSLSEPIRGPACSDAVWHFLGLSMAGWNALISALMALTAFIFTTKAKI